MFIQEITEGDPDSRLQFCEVRKALDFPLFLYANGELQPVTI